MRRPAALSLLSSLLLTTVVLADGAPWQERRRREVQLDPRVLERMDSADWPAEPPSPRQVDRERFGRAFKQLCGPLSMRRAQEYAGYAIDAAQEFGEDPFLLAAMSFRLGQCRQRTFEDGGFGLTNIDREMYLPHLRDGRYRYFVREGGRWAPRERVLDRWPFAGPRLNRAESNLYFAAGLLASWREQHDSVDHAFEQVPHRHHVSHFYWGDAVRSHQDEDRILVHRRRLLDHYGAREPVAPIERLGKSFGPPLFGAPRVVFGYIGDDRDGGERSHRGIDVESMPDEPVLAVADGTVTFSGVDLPGRHNNENMTWQEMQEVPRNDLGRGGRFVCVVHGDLRSDDWVRSCYMHLERVSVRWGQEVRRGDVIGTVGRTGMRGSAAHLHLELHGPDHTLHDASVVLRGHLLGNRPD